MSDAKGGLALKLAKILGEVGKVEKTGHNSFHKYDYITENDLVYAVRAKLSAAGIFVFTSVEDQKVEVFKDEQSGKQSVLTLVKTRHTFVDGDTGEEFSICGAGQGSDVGDKGGYKAITGAMKYFLYKCFMIPTGDDPEADGKTDERSAAGSGQIQRREPARASAPAAKQIEPGDWRSFPVPKFITKYVGGTLGDMENASLADLEYWVKSFQPKPFKGRIQPADEDLRAALDDAGMELFNTNTGR